ncbi:MAG: LL-diaminopimelate aminotransferase [Latescibacteria bacterium DG_63]|nr:MAG: LL-diaminopimelate aminotransferase [Latescibacteria bacterium DG_63]
MRRAERLEKLPPYLFDELDKAKRSLSQRGTGVIDLAVGDPDLPTPREIVERMREAVTDASHHRYPGYIGHANLREALASWFHHRFGVSLDPESEILVLIGSKEGLGHLPLALVNPGEKVLVPDPGYPVYANTSLMAGADVRSLDLEESNGFLPEIEQLGSRGPAKLVFLNYPNNPTGAVADEKFYDRLVSSAAEKGLMVCNDAAYSEITFGGYRSPSILASPGAMECAIEIHSFSKTFNMTGWRIGFAVGNREMLRALAQVKVNLDSCVFGAIQEAAVTAVSMEYDENVRVYAARRKLALESLSKLGCHYFRPKGTFYIWVRVPEGYSSVDFAVRLLEETAVCVAPGSGFGENGEGWFRIALTRPEAEIAEGLQRLAGLNLWTS